MESSIPQPNTIRNLRFAADFAFAMVAGMQLDLFTPLKTGPMTPEKLAQATGVSSSRLRLLLYCLVAAGLLTEKDGYFSNTSEADHFLVKGTPSYVGNLHAALSHRWTALFPHTAESIRSGVPQVNIDFSNSPAAELEAFLRRINPNTVAAAHSLLERYDFSSTRTLADVGCGGAGLALTIAEAYPHMQATAVDLPQITPITQRIVNERGTRNRVQVLAANVLSGPLPGSYDAVVLRGVLQVLSAADARIALKNISAAMNPGGIIYIVAQILDDARVSPPEALEYNLVFINSSDVGESYTEQEHRGWLNEAGLVHVERRKDLLSDGLGLITARKPQ